MALLNLFKAALVIAVFFSGVNIGYHVQKDRHEDKINAALALCDRSYPGTTFVSERFGAYHCFYRRSQYPHRIAYSILVMPRND